MGRKLILVCRQETERQAYLAALEPYGIQIDIVESPDMLFHKMVDGAYSGVMVDLKTKLKASRRAKAVIHDVVEQFPVVQLKWDEKNNRVRSFHFGRSRGIGTLGAFIEEECRRFKPRPLRKSVRRPANFNMRLGRSIEDLETDPCLTSTVNVSLGGCFIYTVEDYEIDSEIRMVMKELEDRTPLVGIVRWRRAWGGESMRVPGIGVQLGDMPPAQFEEFSARAGLPEPQPEEH